MSETTTCSCPDCGMEFRDLPADGRPFECTNCRRRFRLLPGKSGGRAGIVPVEVTAPQEPLGLPKGSIRAIATLAIAGCAWGLMLADTPMPDYAQGLLLTIIGYYFGFRQKDRGEGGRVGDPAEKGQPPLGLPGGTIRLMLIAGFGVSAAILGSRGRIGSAYLEFFLILAGLIAGYFFSRLRSGMASSAASNLINHTVGLIVLVATIRLVVLLLTGNQAAHPQLGLVLACIISFYFGSRS